MAKPKHSFALRFWITVFAFALASAGGFVFGGCHDGPFGRFQARALDAEQESQLGSAVYREIIYNHDVVRDGPIVDIVNKVGKRLAEAASKKEVRQLTRLKTGRFDWEFRVLRMYQANAFCLPGGKVIVFTGILPVAETEAGLAAVIGHEIGHALAHHGSERLAQNMAVGLGEAIIAEKLGRTEEEKEEIMAKLGASTDEGILLPFSREHESEADHIGLILLAAAGYDPHEAIHLWQRMEKMGIGDKMPEFKSTHPSHQHRTRDLENWLPEVMPLCDESQKQAGRTPLPEVKSYK